MSAPLDILTVAEMAEADRLSVPAGTSGLRLMEAAGSAVSEACLRRLGSGSAKRILVLCGPGHNGGDGLVAARRLREASHAVEAVVLCDAASMRGDARLAHERWAAPLSSADAAEWRGADLIVDAMFGAGLNRPAEGLAAAWIQRLNAARCPVVAVDVPSGVEGDSGRILGAAVQATETVTFFRHKPAHLLLPGRDLCGTLTLADIGIMADVLAVIAPKTRLNAPAAWLSAFPRPGAASHKYTRGHVVVVSGPMPTLGAARLAARAAARIGAGLVTVASPHDALAAHAAHLTSIMLRAFEGVGGLEEILADARKNVVVMGPGLGNGAGTRALVEAALRPAGDETRARALVLDADALTSFANDAEGLAALIAGSRAPVVVTPHDGEFARLFGRDGDVASPSKLVRAGAARRRLGATVLLKGDDSVVASPDGRAAIASGRAPWLATAGSGDVLAGMIGGLLAQGMETFGSACAAVYLHAAAGRAFGPGLIAEDLPEALPSQLQVLLRHGATDAM